MVLDTCAGTSASAKTCLQLLGTTDLQVMRRTPRVLGCADMACEGIIGTGFSSRVGHNWKQGSGCEKQNLCEENRSPLIKQKYYWTACAGQTSNGTDHTVTSNTFPCNPPKGNKCIWNVPVHPSFARG